MDEEEEMCKLLKCGYLAAAKIGSTEAAIRTVPDAIPREKRTKIIRCYETLYHDLEELGL